MRLAEQKAPSLQFFQRLLKFTSWAPNWDGQGADHVPIELAMEALEIAQASMPVAGEPFVAPATDGSLLLQWDFSDSSRVELFVEEPGKWDSVTLVEGGQVREIEISGLRDLLRLLYERRVS